MSKISIHYFTGTGNTAHAVRQLSEDWKAKGHEITVIQVLHDVLPPALEADMHLIAFPVLSWAPPVMMQMYLKRFPRSKATKVGILAINGALIMEGKLISGYTGQALEQAERILRRKKMDVFMTGNASFPDNWTQMTNPCTPEDAAVIQQQGEKQVLEFGQKFLDETRELYRCGFLNTLWSWLVAWGFGKLGRRALGTFYIADEHCTGCSICANTCPANTIVMENKLPRWKTRCEDCNRCINICPEKAIQVSMPLMIVQLTLHFVLTVWFVIGFLKYAALLIPEPIWLRILVDIPLFLLASVLSGWMTLVPLEYVFRISMKISAVRRLATKSMTKSFRRYTAPGYKPWK